MEYLMTYGWALLVIVIAIAILLIINPFSAPEGCRFDQVGFTCNNPIVGTNRQLYMSITNGNNDYVDIYQISCTSDKSSASPEAPPEGSPLLATMPKQGAYQINNAHLVLCVNSNGALTYSPGSTFSGKVWVFYRNADDAPDYPYRVASAALVTKINQQAT
jgi:hypothetical protein